MRFLTIVRHAKAAPHGEYANDFDRPLTAKGRAQCEQLRLWANDHHKLGRYGPTTALVSSSLRTRETYAVAFAGTTFVHALETSELIYNGRRNVSDEDLLAVLAEIDPVTDSLLVVGHNPTVLELALRLAREPIPMLKKGNFPVSSAVVFRIDDDRPVGLRDYEFVESFTPDVD